MFFDEDDEAELPSGASRTAALTGLWAFLMLASVLVGSYLYGRFGG